MKLTAKMRILVGQLGLLFSILISAMMLGVNPDHREVVLVGRGELCEALAINSTLFVSRSNLRDLERMLNVAVHRNHDMLSAGIREQTGELLVEAGDHRGHWKKSGEGGSTGQYVNLELKRGEDAWGAMELVFEPVISAGWYGCLEHPWGRMIAFTMAASALLFHLYLGRMLQHLNPAKAVPQRVRSALDTLAEGLMVLDSKGQIVLANEAFGNMVRREPATLVGHPAADFAWDLRESTKEDLPWVKAISEQSPQIENSIHLVDEFSGTRSFKVNCSPVLGDNGNYRGVLVSFDDVTELEMQRVELAESREVAVKANRAKSDFLANMSHEIRTPMNAILGFAELLQRDYGLDEQEKQRYLATIHRSGKHLLNLINDILDLSKVEAGRLEIEPQDCSPHAVITDVVTVLRNRADEKGIALEYHSDGIPETIATDAGRLRQIITNLAGNAIKFTEKGGVTIVARLLDERTDPKLAIDVCDSGIGLTDEQMEKIFDPFVQADASVTRRFGGTGLGLSISRRLALALGGDITISSEPNVGSTFTVTLRTGDLTGIRIADSATLELTRQDGAAEPEVSRRLPPIRILVADDAPPNRELLTLVLECAGAVVETAENGQIAVDLSALSRYDIILMDMQMPVLDGFAATAAIRERNAEVPILALTADAMVGAEERCMAAGCTGFVAKPVEMDVLFRAIKTSLDIPEAPNEEGKPAASKVAAVSPVQNGFPLSPSERAAAGLPDDDEAFRELLGDFRNSLQDQLERMIQAVHRSDFGCLAEEAADIKARAPQLGYDMFTIPADQLITAAHDEASLDDIRRAVGELIAISETLRVPEPEAPIEEPAQPGSASEPLANSSRPPITSSLPLDDPDFQRIVQGFVEHLLAQLDRMEEAWRDGDFESLGQLAHWLKGAGGTLGFDVFTKPATELQEFAEKRDDEQIEPLIAHLQDLASRIEVPVA